MELVDTLDLGSSAARHGGSNPFIRTRIKTKHVEEDAESMEAQLIAEDGLSRKLSIRVPAAALNEKADAKLVDLGKKVKIQGFRPGKIPMTILRQRYLDNVLGEVLEETMQTCVAEALNTHALKPAMQPKVTKTDFEKGKDLDFEVELDVLPVIKLADYSKYELTSYAVQVSDKEIDETLGRLAEQNKTSQKIAKNRKAQEGDIVLIDFKGTVDGQARPGTDAEDFKLVLGSGQFIPGFDEQLIGVKGGEHQTVTVTFPKDYQAKDLAGKEAVFEVNLREIHEEKIAEIDDELAKAMGKDDLSALKADISEDLKKNFQELARNVTKRKLFDQLDESHKFDTPTSMVDAEFDTVWKQVEQDIKIGRLDEEDKDKSEDVLKDEYRKICERRVRLGLVLAEVGKQAGVEVSNDEIREALMREAQRYPGQEQQVVTFYQQNPGALQSLRTPILEEKAVDAILKAAKTSKKKITAEKLQEEFNA